MKRFMPRYVPSKERILNLLFLSLRGIQHLGGQHLKGYLFPDRSQWFLSLGQ